VRRLRGVVTPTRGDSVVPRAPVTLWCPFCGKDIAPEATSYFLPGGNLAFGEDDSGKAFKTCVYYGCEECIRPRIAWGDKRRGPCEACGRPVVGGRFCSRSCEGHVYRASRSRDVMATCRGCGATFSQPRSDAVYCSNRCRQRAWRRRAEEART
jgi:hypothetical protein